MPARKFPLLLGKGVTRRKDSKWNGFLLQALRRSYLFNELAQINRKLKCSQLRIYVAYNAWHVGAKLGTVLF